ncbi:MAG: EFR1 family ferrodoxin [Victivallaceae bacterium]|jgi:ferredoxin/flavodoxin
MPNEIFFFSGTGNSLALAKSLAGKLGSARLTKIRYAGEAEIVSAAEKIGIIYPVYSFGMPKIVKAFIGKLKVMPNSYIFAICNYAGMSGSAMKQTQKALAARNIKLNSGFGLVMPSNYLPFGGAEPEEKFQKKVSRAESRLEEIAGIVKAGESKNIENPWYFPYWLTEAANRYFIKSIVKEVNKFHADGKCAGCGLCAKVCPSANIRIIDGKPQWGTNCELCLACLQWCPAHAIQMGTIPPGRKRYHHPDIKAEEMLYNK